MSKFNQILLSYKVNGEKSSFDNKKKGATPLKYRPVILHINRL